MGRLSYFLGLTMFMGNFRIQPEPHHTINAINASDNNVRPGKFNSAGRVIVNFAAVLTLSAIVSGCAVNKTMSRFDNDRDIITGSVTKPVEVEGIDPTDAEKIKLAVVEAEKPAADSHLLAWNNPQTGNSGTITAIDQYIGNSGQSCRKFRTTVDSFMGIALYNGETCELKKGFWVLSWFIRDEAA